MALKALKGKRLVVPSKRTSGAMVVGEGLRDWGRCCVPMHLGYRLSLGPLVWPWNSRIFLVLCLVLAKTLVRNRWILAKCSLNF